MDVIHNLVDQNWETQKSISISEEVKSEFFTRWDIFLKAIRYIFPK